MAPAFDKIGNFIGGQFVEPVGWRYLDNIEPATGKTYSQVPDSDNRDIRTGRSPATTFSARPRGADLLWSLISTGSGKIPLSIRLAKQSRNES